MFKPGIVSVISPCYNVAQYLPFFCESLLSQTYRKLEIILVNDGSSDNTHDVISFWLPKLESAGFLTKYIVKENGGQSSAINEALRHFTGEFLTWVDPDDFLYSESISKRVTFLTKNPQLGLVRCECDIYNENDRNKIIGVIRGKKRTISSENIFRDLIFERTYITSHCYMVRCDAFLDVNPNRKIYVRKDAGQNWQMLLPVTAKYDCGYLPISLCGYLIRAESHSHVNVTLDSKLRYLDMSLDVLKNTLQNIGLGNLSFLNELDIHFSIKRYHLGFEFKNRILVRNELAYLERICGLKAKQKIVKLSCKCSMLFNAIKVFWFLQRLPKRIIFKLINIKSLPATRQKTAAVK